MKKNNLEEQEIESLLREMPSLKDNRSREEVYKAITSKNRTIKKTRTWGYPALAGLAALMIIILISPSLFNSINQAQYENSAADMATDESADSGTAESEIAALPENAQDSSKTEEKSVGETDSTQQYMLTAESQERTSVYQEDLLQYDLLTYGLVTSDAVAVPVSVLIEKKEDIPWFERYMEVSQEIPEQSWGFDEYYPLAGTLGLNEANNELTYTVTEEELTNLSGGGEKILTDSIGYLLQTSDYTKVNLKTADGSIPSFSHMGEVAEISKIDNKDRGYYSYSVENGETYLVPGDAEYDSISEAFKAMKESPNGIYEPVISNEIQTVLTSENNMLTVAFEEQLQLNDSEGGKDSLFIEAILMTAKSFGFEKVMFRNVENPAWKGFDFSQPVSVPISPNKKIHN